MSTDIELATIYSLSKVGQELSSLLADPKISIDKNISDDINDVSKLLNSASDEYPTVTSMNFNAYSPFGIEFYIKVSGLDNRYRQITLHEQDTSRVGIIIDDEFQSLLTDKENLLMRLHLNNQDIRYVDNFLGASALEYIFSRWKPKYCWLAYYSILYDFKTEKFDSSFHDTPWLHYSETMIFGPELVDSMRLKDFDWNDENIFFSKWIAEDVLWLASPWGQHSRYQDFGESYVDFHNSHLDVQIKHMNTVSERLNLKKGSW